jgi:hypothetical protein
MKTKMTIAMMSAIGALALAVNAQDNNQSPGGSPPDGAAGGPTMDGQGEFHPHRPPLPVIVRALDVNHDGVIDSNEIANASAVLKSLDKNGDGKLSMEEVMGPRPQRPGGQSGPDRSAGGNSGGDDNNMPPSGPPPGDGDGNTPPSGPPPGNN